MLQSYVVLFVISSKLTALHDSQASHESYRGYVEKLVFLGENIELLCIASTVYWHLYKYNSIGDISDHIRSPLSLPPHSFPT